MDVQYIDIDDEGLPLSKSGRPKWQIPETDLQKEIVTACKCKYFKKHEKGAINLIDHSMMPLIQGVKPAKYPTEWVKGLIEWARKKNNQNGYPIISVQALISAINNEDRKNEWIGKKLNGTRIVEEKDYGVSPYDN